MGVQSVVLGRVFVLSRRFFLGISFFMLLGEAGCSSTSGNQSGHIPVLSAPMSVLILPFSNLTTTPDAGKSVTTILTSSLIRQNQLRVIPSDSLPFPVTAGISAINVPPGLRDRLRSMGVDTLPEKNAFPFPEPKHTFLLPRQNVNRSLRREPQKSWAPAREESQIPC